MNRLVRVLIVGSLAATAFSVLSGADESNHEVAQTVCPVMEGNPIKKNIYVDYQGERIYFCCEFCKAAFTKEPGKYLDGLPQFVGKVDSGEEKLEHEEDKHDHAVDHDTKEEGPSRLIAFLGKFHPIAVHIPIALVLVAALAEVLGMLTAKEVFLAISRFNIQIAFLGALVAIGLGLSAEESANYAGDYARVLKIHEWAGIGVGVMTAMGAVLSQLAYTTGKRLYRWSYRGALLLCVVLVGATGFLGGQLVYGLNHYTW